MLNPATLVDSTPTCHTDGVTHDPHTFVRYIDKSRAYYAAQGYRVPYRWAAHTEAPFAPLRRPLAECRVGVITTASLERDAPLEPYTAPSTPAPTSMTTEHLSWHKEATTTDDLGSFLPLDHLRQLADDGIIGALAPRFAGIPTVYSQRRTETWAAELHQEFTKDDVDLVVLIPL